MNEWEFERKKIGFLHSCSGLLMSIFCIKCYSKLSFKLVCIKPFNIYIYIYIFNVILHAINVIFIHVFVLEDSFGISGKNKFDNHIHMF